MLINLRPKLVGHRILSQLANIYISITAGSIWRSVYDIIDKPYNCLVILGKALPTVAGYFISLLLTKILAGLPMVLLRFGALARMLLLKALFNESFMTQREVIASHLSSCAEV
jgi:hypothetical protein